MQTLGDAVAWIVSQHPWTARWFLDGETIVQIEGKQWGKARWSDDKPASPLLALGCTGTDAQGVVRWIGVDIDVGHGEGYDTRAEAEAAGMRLMDWCDTPCELRSSKSGEGLHFRAVCGIKVAPLYAPKLARQLCDELQVRACPSSVGRQAHWLWARKPASGGYALVKEKGW